MAQGYSAERGPLPEPNSKDAHGSRRSRTNCRIPPRSRTWLPGLDSSSLSSTHDEATDDRPSAPASGPNEDADPKSVRRSTWPTATNGTAHRPNVVDVPVAKGPTGSTLRAVFKDLHDHDADCVIKLRRLQQFDHASAENVLRRHFQHFGSVERVWIVYSQLKANRNTVPRCKPSGLGFILMRSAEDVHSSLQQGSEQTAAGFRITVERFRVLAEGRPVVERHLSSSSGHDLVPFVKPDQAKSPSLSTGITSLWGNDDVCQFGPFILTKSPRAARTSIVVRNTFLHVREQSSARRSSSI